MSIISTIWSYILNIADVLQTKSHHPAPVTAVPSSPLVMAENRSSVQTDAQVQTYLPALQVQMDRDFGPLFYTTCRLQFLPKGKTAPNGSFLLSFLDDAGQAGALGYHDFTPQGQPISIVQAKVALDNGFSVSVTASHELCEMMSDFGVDLQVQMDDTHEMAYEVCDAVEDDSKGYFYNGVHLSDFVTPEYFMTNPPRGKKLDFMGYVSQPFEILPGGYANIKTDGIGWGQSVNGASKRSVLRTKR